MTKKLFLLTVFLGLAVNLYGDLKVLDQSRTSMRTGDWVEQSHCVTKSIDSTRIDILDSLRARHLTATVRADIKHLNTLVKDMPPQEARAAKLLNLTDAALLAQKENLALITLAEMSASEDSILHLRVHFDEEANRAAVQQALVCNAIDVLLIFLFLGFFFYERRRAVRVQLAITKTLQDVEASNRKLQLALSRRDAKMRITVHDLKSPLGSIKGFAEMISEDSSAEMAGYIQKLCGKTLALIEEIMDDPAPAQAHEEPVNLLETVRESVLLLMPLALRKGQNIHVDRAARPFMMMASKNQIQDVLFNLIGNALKFSPHNSAIHVECNDLGEVHELVVRDRGPGFQAADFSKLFMPGTPLSAKSTGGESSHGLGLFSVKQTVDNLGGEIAIENLPGGGARVAIRLRRGNTLHFSGSTTTQSS